MIEDQVKHLMRLVDDLLDVSRITRGSIELRKEPIALSRIVVEAVEMASPLFEQRSHLRFIPSAPPARIQTKQPERVRPICRPYPLHSFPSARSLPHPNDVASRPSPVATTRCMLASCSRSTAAPSAVRR